MKAYPSSDIDIYLYGLSEDEFIKKVKKIYTHIKSIDKEAFMVETPLTITIISKFPSRPIQIVTGKWNYIQQIILEPDIDCTCFGFNGNSVITTYRGRASFNTRTIVTGPERSKLRPFPEYETRIVKYSRRGFWVIDPKLNYQNISEEGISRTAERMESENPGSNFGVRKFLFLFYC
jgi:hypothetical protein